AAATGGEGPQLLTEFAALRWLRPRTNQKSRLLTGRWLPPATSYFSLFTYYLSLRLGKNTSSLAFFARLIRIFDFVQDTPARQNASELAIALAYSYLCRPETNPS
ncbi:hypothetical protein, partial [uncultured Alistipes sp.]|uniref:hypothetical protein n=1 Tax=uncultured Alistipes sp. TaxID=538949 RepID=UPI00261309C3